MQYRITKSITAYELAQALELDFIGVKEQEIKSVGSLANIGQSVLKFSTKNVEEPIDGIVIGIETIEAQAVIVSSKPRLDFCRAVSFLIDEKYLTHIEHSCEIHETAVISANAIIEASVFIGENTIVEHNVVIHKGTRIGSNCIIRSNSVIGSQGFGFEQNQDKTWIRFPHLGSVIIKDNVEIGALNSICVGALDDTVIGEGVKTDNLVHIAHNCIIGSNSILTACTELSGGVTLGESVWMGPNSSTMQKVTIADGALVGLASVVTKNVSAGDIVAGSPAKIIKRGTR